MTKETYKGTNVKSATIDKVLDLLIELFTKYDLNDNSSIDFNNFISEIRERNKVLDKELKTLKTKLNKETSAKIYYKTNLLKNMGKEDIMKLLEEKVE